MTNDELIAKISKYYDICIGPSPVPQTNEQKVMTIINSHNILRQNNMKRSKIISEMSGLKQWILFKLFKELW